MKNWVRENWFKVIVLVIVALVVFGVNYFLKEQRINKCIDRVLANTNIKSERVALAICRTKYNVKECSELKFYFDEECSQEQKNKK